MDGLKRLLKINNGKFPHGTSHYLWLANSLHLHATASECRDSVHYGVDPVEPGSSNCPPDSCIKLFESQHVRKKSPNTLHLSTTTPECRDSLPFRFAERKVLPPSSWRQANVHRTLALDGSNLATKYKNRNSRCCFGFYGPSVEIRTRGLLNPIQARYQTSPHPDILFAALGDSDILPHNFRKCKHYFYFF